jgi:phage-related minor tail protein
MVTFRNNNNNNIRRNNFRRNDRNFKSSSDRPKFGSNFSNNENFKRKAPGRNNHNASKLIEKYNDLAREASSNGDKILSENYLQHADHFTRIQNEQDNLRKARFTENKLTNINDSTEETSVKKDEVANDMTDEKVEEVTKGEKIAKSQPEVN